MSGKMALLRPKDYSTKGFEVVYEIGDSRNLDFAEIILSDTTPNATTTYIYGGHIVKEQGDGYKQITVFNGKLPKDAVEEYILLIVPYAGQLVAPTSKRIAGRYCYEAIFEMHEGDKIEISKSHIGKREIYIVVKAENELFLIKKNR